MLLMSKDLQFYCSISEWNLILVWMVLVKTIYYILKSAELFGSFTARTLLMYLERNHKDCLCVYTFSGVLQHFLLTYANSVNLPFY